VGLAVAIAATAPQRLRVGFALRANRPLAGVAKATTPKNYSALPPLPYAELQLKHTKQGSD